MILVKITRGGEGGGKEDGRDTEREWGPMSHLRMAYVVPVLRWYRYVTVLAAYILYLCDCMLVLGILQVFTSTSFLLYPHNCSA